MKLLDLFCGRGGWSRVAVSRGWEVVGIDAAPQPLYPGPFILQVLPVSAAALIAAHAPDAVAVSPPCEQFARHHLPWLKGPPPDLSLMQWSLSLIDAMPCPVIVECSRFAGWHFPRSSRCGSLRLWGAVPPLLPTPAPHKSRLPGYDAAGRAVIPWEVASVFIDAVESGCFSRSGAK